VGLGLQSQSNVDRERECLTGGKKKKWKIVFVLYYDFDLVVDEDGISLVHLHPMLFLLAKMYLLC
jgi:hypothetical protein